MKKIFRWIHLTNFSPYIEMHSYKNTMIHQVLLYCIVYYYIIKFGEQKFKRFKSLLK